MIAGKIEKNNITISLLKYTTLDVHLSWDRGIA
jgi:hypothetical protein